jgi:hypothetical protein
MAAKQIVINDLFEALIEKKILVVSKRSLYIFVPAPGWVIKYTRDAERDFASDVIAMYKSGDLIAVDIEGEMYAIDHTLDEIITYQLFKEADVMLQVKMKTPGELFLEEMKVKLANMSDEEFVKRVNAVSDEDDSMTVDEYLQQVAGINRVDKL